MSEDTKKVISDLYKEVEYHKSIVSIHNGKLLEVRDRIKKLERGLRLKNIKVSDHAVVTYMKRFKSEVLGLDIEEVKELMADRVRENGLAIGGNGKVTVNDVTYVIKNHIILTVYDKKNTD